MSVSILLCSLKIKGEFLMYCTVHFAALKEAQKMYVEKEKISPPQKK